VGRGLLFLCALSCAAQSLIIKNVTVIDATGAAREERLGRDRRRQDQRDQEIDSCAARSRVVDGKGQVSDPGLWDMHMHLPPASPPFDDLVAHGITGVREMFTGFRSSS
jgi:N-acyl-D-aspartate/D-glutamate deacylase